MDKQPNSGIRRTQTEALNEPQPTEVVARDSQPSMVQASRTEFSVHAGPLPAPRDLADYEIILPGAADRILTMAENQAKHRMAIETRVLADNSLRSKLGLGAGFVVAMTALVISGYIASHGAPWPGSLLGTGSLGGLVAVFVTGTNSQKEERLKKAQMMTGQQEPSQEAPGNTKAIGKKPRPK